MFNIRGRVALITGGASGIGFHCAQELLRNDLKGVTLADINPATGEKAIEIINNEFGSNRAIFAKTDVLNRNEFSQAFEKTIESFGHIDILINNAGICNEKEWEKEIALNINGVVHGMILGIDRYLQTHRQGSEALILNMSSLSFVTPSCKIPIYSGTKCAVVGMTRAWSQVYEKSKVRVVAVCPGYTETGLIENFFNKTLAGNLYEETRKSLPTQTPSFVAQEVTNVIKYAPNGTVWVVNNKPAVEYTFPSLASLENNLLPSK